MEYSVVYKESVHRDLKNLSRAVVKRILDSIERELVKKPESNPVLKGEFAGLRKYRVGDYRVIYVVLGNEIVVLRIGKRKNIYKCDEQEVPGFGSDCRFLARTAQARRSLRMGAGVRLEDIGTQPMKRNSGRGWKRA
ncbi:MAG TPA: type II toxin-antitoxin system RelE/ParE family toxin [Candidatus Methanoperedens sp.]|nr:type II toxin-antitoxin system RelE/ParE family toxin [Candidatus Methanoperedens sp.]